MSELKELKRLKDEERTLISLASLLTDQLNRLKVEELALLSKRRLQTSSAHSNMSASSRPDHDVYVAEEIAARALHRSASLTQEVAQTPTKLETNRTQLIIPSEDQLDDMTYDDSHMIPLDLAVTSHEPEGMKAEIEEEEEEEAT